MATFLEFHIKGGGTAIIDTSSICGAICSGSNTAAPGTAAAPTLVVLRSGEHLEVIGESPAKVIVRMVMIRERFRKEPGAQVLVGWLEPMEGDDDEPGAGAADSA